MSRRPDWRSFFARGRVPWVAWLLVSGAVVFTAVQSLREIDEQLTGLVLSRREGIAQLTAAHLAEKFKNVEDVTVSLATRVRFRNLVAAGRWQDAIDIMRGVPRDLPYIDRLVIADRRGTLQADVPALPGVRGVNFAYREWFQGLRAGQRTHVSSVFTRLAKPQRRVFSVSTPIRDAAGGTLGILAVQIRSELLVDWVEVADVGPEGFIYIVDARGQLVFDSRKREQTENVDLSKLPVVQRLLRGERGVEIGPDPQDGVDSVVAYASTPRYGWGVVVQQPTSSSGLEARDAQLRRLATGYGLILVLFSATLYLVARIARAHRRAEEERQLKTELERRVTERTAELAAANKDLEAFSYSVSHDLRAPLRAIDGFSRLLLEEHAGQLNAEGRDHLARVRQAAQRMGNLIDELLELSRVGRSEMHVAEVDLSALAGTVVELLRVADPARAVEVSIARPLAGRGDERLLQRVLENLLGNAWKYTRRTEHARIEFDAIQENGETVYRIRDNGVGFDMQYAGKLFQPFQRLHRPEEFEGTGVGLAIVARIIRRHGGRVWAEAAPGQGATFSFVLGSESGKEGGI